MFNVCYIVNVSHTIVYEDIYVLWLPKSQWSHVWNSGNVTNNRKIINRSINNRYQSIIDNN